MTFEKIVEVLERMSQADVWGKGMTYRGIASMKALGGIYLSCARVSKEEAVVAGENWARRIVGWCQRSKARSCRVL